MAKFTTVDSVDLNGLTHHNAVTMKSRAEDGRERHFSVDVFQVLGGFAYGAVLDLIEDEDRVGIYQTNPDTRMRVARLPLEGDHITPGVASVDTAALDRGIGEIPEDEWETVEVPVEEIVLVDRAA